jgi:hypothetical protein
LFDELFKMIQCLQKSHHPYTRYEIWSIWVEYLKVISERPMILTCECCALGEGAIPIYFNRRRFDAAGPSGARTHDLSDAKRQHYH